MPRGSHPHDVAPAADGAIWYTAQASGALGRLDPATGEIIEYPIPRAENTMRDFFLDAQGRMWFGSPANDRVGYFYLKDK